MAARAAVRDVGRALGMSYSDVDAVARQIPRTLGVTLADAVKGEGLAAMMAEDERVRHLVEVARALEGMPRHASTHAAGVVITERPLSEYVPLAVNNGVVVTQYDMNTVADLGLLKFDFLALRYLTIIAQAEAQIREERPDFDIAAIPLDDARTFELIAAGRTDGVFQLESGGMRQTLMQMKPSRIDDIIAAIALYRPGPMDSIPKYIENSRDPSKIRYVTPLLAPILDVTNGCIVYQEQVMQIFRAVAGYSLGRADIVRRAISKKKLSVLESERAAFLSGAAEHGVAADAAAALFEEIVGFANYAFNKSHAAAYGVLSYRSAYLKAHYPRQYISALMTSVLGDSDKLAEYIGECARLGIRILPPHVNDSAWDFHVDGVNIRFGLLALKNLGRQFVDALIAERQRGGRFLSFDDFLSRMSGASMNKRQLEMLIKSGSLDGLGASRRQMLTVYEAVLDARSASARQSVEGQLDLFSAAPSSPQRAAGLPRLSLPDVAEFSARELLRLEKESSGLYFSGHILDDYSQSLSGIRLDTAAAIKAAFREEDEGSEEAEGAPAPEYAEKQTVTLAGVFTKKQIKATRAGEQMAFLTLEDRTGEIEIVAFPKALAAMGDALGVDRVVLLRGTISVRDDEEPKILLRDGRLLPENGAPPPQTSPASSVPAPPSAPTGPVSRLFLRVKSMEDPACRRASCLLTIFPGETAVIFYDASSGKYLRAEHLNAAATPFVLRELGEILGADAVAAR